MKRILALFRREEPGGFALGGVENFLFVFGSTILFLLFVNLLIAGIVFIAGGVLAAWIPVTAIMLAAGFAFWYGGKYFVRRKFLLVFAVIAAAAVMFIGSVLFTSRFYDISYDGQTYQQEAVIQLSHGWNPVYQDLTPAQIGGTTKWINYYPKASWIGEASIYLLTHEEQAGKAQDIVLIIVSIALLYAAFRESGLLGRFDASLVALLAGLNPVSLGQSLSYYVDGELMSLFLCVCAFGIIMYARRRPLAYLPFLFTIPVFVNLKFTSLVDAILLAAVFILAFWMARAEILTAKTFIGTAAAVIVGVLVIGASPYLTNTVRYHTPFYPLLGSGAIDLKPYNVPANFVDKSSPEIFFMSAFSQSAGLKGASTSNAYKLPFTYSPGELVAFRYPDPDEGGFGPLFGGALILAAIGMAAYWFWSRGRDPARRKNRRKFWGAFWIMVAVLAFCLIDPISSLARYVPQGYLLALVPIVLFLFAGHAGRGRMPLRAFAYLMAALLVFNAALIADTYYSYNGKISSEIAAELGVLRADAKTKSILVHFQDFPSTRMMLQEADIPYTATNNVNICRKGFRQLLPENTTQFCVYSP